MAVSGMVSNRLQNEVPLRKSHRMRELVRHRSNVHTVVFLPHGREIASLGGSETRPSITQVASGERRYLPKASEPVVALHPLNGGRQLVGLLKFQGLAIWELGEDSLTELSPVVFAEVRNADQAYPSALGSVGFFDLDPEAALVIGGTRLFGPMFDRFYNDSEMRPAGGWNLHAIDRNTGQPVLWGVDYGLRTVHGLAPLPEHRLVVLGKRIFETYSTKERLKFEILDREGRFLSGEEINADFQKVRLAVVPSTHAALITAGNQVIIGDFETNTWVRQKVHSDRLTSVLAMPDGSGILAGSKDGRISLWNPPDPECVQQWDWEIGAITALAVSPDQQLLVAGSEKTVFLWDRDF